MRVTVAEAQGGIHNLEVHGDMDLESFKALLGAEINQPNELISLSFNNVELRSNKPLTELGIKDDDLLLLNILHPVGPSSTNPSNIGNMPQQLLNKIELMRQQIISNPQLLERLKKEQPDLHDSALKGSAEFSAVYTKYEMQKAQLEMQRNQEIAKLEADPFNVEAQMKIESIIKEQNIMSNMQNAMEHNPESFAQVHMLYIHTTVNGYPVKAFVDSGAQSTIMNPSCAEACGILRLLDTRFAGIARGVGTAKILGRVHSAPLKIGNQFYPCSFTVMEGKGVDFLLGLDMLKRYQACIDLKANALVISDEKVPFLAEHEIPKELMEDAASAPLTEVQQPSSSGTNVTQDNTQFSENSIKQLMEVGGLSREQAIAMLQQTSGNLDLAIELIFN
ncbi:DNA damage-inducible protein 1 [Entomophthora muscae]|uniref:DNA damage-inducible protein 1 n=1 Tax=Entomophthora muscae TaxID=34485 RepID=A0ACC2SRN7_9FUNG|nr:DNA damage-inducible protein 1 [Entomophthora muscae]